MKFTWDLIIANFADFSLISRLPTKNPQIFTPSIFTLLNFGEIGCKQCNENDKMASFSCYFTWNPRKIIPTSKVWNPNSQKPEKSKIREIKLPQKSPSTRFLEMWKLWTILFIVQFEWVCILISTITHSRIASIFRPRKPPPPQVRKCPYAYDYMQAREYEFYFRVLNLISHEWAQRSHEILSWTREDKVRTYKWA